MYLNNTPEYYKFPRIRPQGLVYVTPWFYKTQNIWFRVAHHSLILTSPICNQIRGHFPVLCGGRCTAPGGVQTAPGGTGQLLVRPRSWMGASFLCLFLCFWRYFVSLSLERFIVSLYILFCMCVWHMSVKALTYLLTLCLVVSTNTMFVNVKLLKHTQLTKKNTKYSYINITVVYSRPGVHWNAGLL